MKHVSLDLETLGSGPNAAVVAIGAVEFDPLTGEEGRKFYAAISAKSAVKGGGRIEPSTVLWWMQQSEEARKEIVTASESVHSALRGFSFWIDPASFVWGNGSGFDNARLREAYARVRLDCPFHFRNDMDLRTLRATVEALGLECDEVARVGTHHNALDDAIYQARLIVSFFRALNGADKPPA